MLSRDVEDIKKTNTELLEKKTTMSEMKGFTVWDYHLSGHCRRKKKNKTHEPEDGITEAIQDERQKERIKKINRKGENQN